MPTATELVGPDHRTAAGPDPQPLRQRRHARLGRGDPQRRPPADLPRGRRPRRRSASTPRPGGRRSSPASRAPTRGARAVPDGPHRRRARQPRGLVARPVRRRAGRRRGVGPRRDRHAQPHGVDGGRLPPPGHRGLPAQGRPDLLRRRRRGGRRRSGAPSGCSTTTGTPSAPTTCSPSSAAGRRSTTTATATSRSTSARRASPGAGCACTARPATARCRSASDNALLKAAEVVRRLGTFRTPGRASTTLWQRRVEVMPIDAELRVGPARSGPDLGHARHAAARRRPDRPRLHAHHDLAQRRPRRAEDQHDPRRRRPRRRHPHRARRHRETVDGYLAEALGDLADRVEISAAPGVRGDPVADRQPAVGLDRRRACRSPTRAPTWCPA